MLCVIFMPRSDMKLNTQADLMLGYLRTNHSEGARTDCFGIERAEQIVGRERREPVS